jgi:hypothetical protein
MKTDIIHRQIAFRAVLARLRFRFQACLEFVPFAWSHHFHVGDVRSAGMVGRTFFCRRRAIAPRRSGRRGFGRYGWRTLSRDRSIDGWHGASAFAPFARFSAFEDNAAVFGHTRPAGLEAVLLQQVSDGSVGHILLTQFHDGIMNRFQTVERNAMRIRLVFLNRFLQSFEIGL